MSLHRNTSASPPTQFTETSWFNVERTASHSVLSTLTCLVAFSRSDLTRKRQQFLGTTWLLVPARDDLRACLKRALPFDLGM